MSQATAGTILYSPAKPLHEPALMMFAGLLFFGVNDERASAETLNRLNISSLEYTNVAVGYY
jgi:hypothetical protein